MKKEEYKKLCRSLSSDPGHALTRAILPLVDDYRARHNYRKLPVLWIETNDSGDNNIAFMNTTYPYLGRVFTDMIDLLYSNTFMAAQGRDALDILLTAPEKLKGGYTLVVEGAIPVKDNGLYNFIARTETRNITALEAVTRLGAQALYVVAIGTCASFGGPSAARPNITGSVGVRDVLDREVINVSGCPVNPDWFVGTLAHLLMYGRPELDRLGRPTLFYGFTVHRHCQRRSYFDRGDFAERLGDIECMFSLGCMGPVTGADCPYRQWINYVNWPVRANTPCIGCTNEDFPDGSTPFFTPMTEKGANQGGGGVDGGGMDGGGMDGGGMDGGGMDGGGMDGGGTEGGGMEGGGIIEGVDNTQNKKTQDKNIAGIKTQDEVTRDKVTRDKVNRDKVTKEKVARDKVTKDKVAKGKITQDWVTQDKLNQDQVTQDKNSTGRKGGK